MANSYNYHFGGQAGIFISSIGGLAHGLIYQDEFFIVMSSVMLLVSSPIWFKIKKMRKNKTKLSQIFVRLCIASVFFCTVVSNGLIIYFFVLSGIWINILRNDDST